MARCGGHVHSVHVSDYRLVDSTSQAVKSKKVAVYVLEVQGRTRLFHPSVFFTEAHHFREFPTFHCKMRFRDLRQMNISLVTKHPNTALPAFPPKKWFGNKSEEFLQNRMRRLDQYFRELLTLPQVTSGDSLLLALQPVAVWDIAVVGMPKIGKAQFVKRFLHYKPISSDIPEQYLSLVSRIRNIEASSAVFPDLHSFSEIEQFTPIDLIIDGWLVRVNSIQLHSVEFPHLDSAEHIIASKDGALLLYNEDVKRSEGVAETLEVTYRASKPVEKVRVWETLGGALEQMEAAEQAYNAVTQFLRRLLHKPD